MNKSCPQCQRMKPLVVRWFAHNFGRIPWDGFMLPREKKAVKEAMDKIVAFSLPPEEKTQYDHLLPKNKE